MHNNSSKHLESFPRIWQIFFLSALLLPLLESALSVRQALNLFQVEGRRSSMVNTRDCESSCHWTGFWSNCTLQVRTMQESHLLMCIHPPASKHQGLFFAKSFSVEVEVNDAGATSYHLFPQPRCSPSQRVEHKEDAIIQPLGRGFFSAALEKRRDTKHLRLFYVWVKFFFQVLTYECAAHFV